MFQPENQKLPDFLESLPGNAEKAFGEAAPKMIESLIYAKMPPYPKKSINQAFLENDTYDENVRHLERGMELNGLEADEPLVKTQMTVVKQQSSSQNATTPSETTQANTITPDTVPKNTLQINEYRYCKGESHIVKEFSKIAKQQKMDQDPDAPKCFYCNAPRHEDPNCFVDANEENHPALT